MRTRILNTKIWADEYFSNLSMGEKLVFIYYLTNERVNIIHCYECPDRYVALDTGVSIGVLRGYKEKFMKDKKFSFYKGYIHLLNADKYESYKGPKNKKAKERLIRELSSDILDWYINKSDRGIDSSIDTTRNHKSEIINNNIKGVIGGKDLEEKDFQEIAERYGVPLSFVISKWEDLQNWCQAKGRRYKDYRAALRNWVKKDAMNIRKEAAYESRRVSIGNIE